MTQRKSNVGFTLTDLPCFTTVARCHVTAGAVVIALLIATVWVAGNPDKFCQNQDHTRVDVESAFQLISESSQWREKHANASVRFGESQSQAEKIRSWLPTSIDWEAARQDIIGMAERCSLTMNTIQEDSRHNGSRVSVVVASCKVQGSYPNICKMLHLLSQRQHPIWCDSVKLIRLSTEDEVVDPNCEATLTMRLPYAGQGTLGMKLFEVEANRDI